MKKPTDRDSISQLEATEQILDLVRQGRTIVPLVGAGISVDAGVPTLSHLTRYLAATKFYLRFKLYQGLPDRQLRVSSFPEWSRWWSRWRTGDEPAIDLMGTSDSNPPWEYLQRFGWPDPQQLKSDLWHWILYSQDPAQNDIPWEYEPEEIVLEGVEEIIQSELRLSLESIDDLLVQRLNLLDRICQDPRWGAGTGGSGRGFSGDPFGEAVPWMTQGQHPLRGGGYWKILLDQLTRSSPDLVDLLFQQLFRGRGPGQAHRYLAFLTPAFRLRLFLSINFDPLLERALRGEGYRPKVYDVAEGLHLPSPQLIREGLAVVKLHGGAYGLMVGEGLDRPLDEETRKRFKEYLSESPLLLVLGVGGWDARVLDLVELVRECKGTVFWQHFGSVAPESLERRSRLASKSGSGDQEASWLRTFRAGNPGAFLRGLYLKYKESHPSSSVPFRSHDQRPTLLRDPSPGTASRPAEDAWSNPVSDSALDSWNGRVKIFLDDRDNSLTAAQKLAKYVDEIGESHLPLWVDVETKLTVEDVVVELVTQLRRYDPALPPEILAIGRSAQGSRQPREGATNYSKVVRRLYAALARGRYVIALNGILDFGRPPTRHHAEEDHDGEQGDPNGDPLAGLWNFLFGESAGTLATVGQGILGLTDSVVALAIDGVSPSALEDLKTRSIGEARKVFEGLKGRAEPSLSTPIDQDDLLHSWGLLVLSAFRRRRSWVSMKTLGFEISRESRSTGATEPVESFEEFLNRTTSPSPVMDPRALLQVEGAYFWMNRKVRNQTYEAIRSVAVAEEADPSSREAQAALIVIHREIAVFYEDKVYPGSQDATSLLEAIYHRVASLRYLAILWANSGEWSEESLQKFWVRKLLKPLPRPCPEQVVYCQLVDALRALQALLSQHRDHLLAAIPARTLRSWLQALRNRDLFELWGRVNGHERAGELERLMDNLAQSLIDLEASVLMDGLRPEELEGLRLRNLQRVIAPESPDPWWMDPAPGQGDPAPPDNLDEFFQVLMASSQTEPPEGLWKRRELIVKSLMDIAAVRDRTGQNPSGGLDLRQALSHIEEWEPDITSPDYRKFLDLRLKPHLLVADCELWSLNPWTMKGVSDQVFQKKKEQLLRAKDAVTEVDKVFRAIPSPSASTRSYFYSLKGRLSYLAPADREEDILADPAGNRFKKSYRYFDEARAGLSEAVPEEREALAVVFLRQAECLMLHADEELTGLCFRVLRKELEDSRGTGRQENGEGVTANNRGEGLLLEHLSENGRQKCRGVKPNAMDLLSLSLSNWNPRTVENVESILSSRDSAAVSMGLGIARARLASASDLLDRVESLLESSRRKVWWWSCLFSLRAQMAVEHLLLLISGCREPGLSHDPMAKERHADKYLRYDLGRRLREGLTAVRQGLDILLPSEPDRNAADLSRNLYLSRLLRLWLELLICGAFLHDHARSVNARQEADEIKKEEGLIQEKISRWNQWVSLNRRSGIVILPTCKAVKHQHDRQSDWNMGSPSLMARARVLARIDIWLRKPVGSRDGQGCRGESSSEGSLLGCLVACLCPSQPNSATAHLGLLTGLLPVARLNSAPNQNVS